MKLTISIILFSLFANILFSQKENMIISGTVTDAINSLSIEHAKIWDQDKPGKVEYSVANGGFEINTDDKRILLICKKEGYRTFRKFVTPPEYHLEMVLQPITVETLELTLIIKELETKKRIRNTQLYFDNINGYDNLSTEYKHIIDIPLKAIENRNNELQFSIKKYGYQIIDTSIVFNEDEKRKKLKNTELYLTPDTIKDTIKDTITHKNFGLKINSIALNTVALYCGISWLVFKEKANDLYSNISPVLSQKVDDWGEYKKYKTRSNMMGLTAINSTMSSLPFVLDWINKKPNIDKKLLSGIFFLGSAVFFTFGLISHNRANDIDQQLKTTYSQISNGRVTKMGEYYMYREREKFFYINSAINLSTAINILFFYDRNKETKTNVSVLFNIPSNNAYSPSFCFTFKKKF